MHISLLALCCRTFPQPLQVPFSRASSSVFPQPTLGGKARCLHAVHVQRGMRDDLYLSQCGRGVLRQLSQGGKEHALHISLAAS